MGEVYRAHDTRLGRDVAIKILPALWTQDPDRLARLGREARMLATLNHPHIGAIYGIEDLPAEAGSHGRALVLELIDGETLEQRIARGPVPVADALRIAGQIADALATAHDKDIVHRDLKPANVKLTAAGAVKVLDFGIAKAASPRAEWAGTTFATREGAVIGTPAYMSPEQTRGEDVDKRSDAWAFGCVLYEMLTARRAFGGATVSEAIAAVLEREPDWSALPARTPGPITALLRRCLQKDVARRLRDLRDAGLEIQDAATTRSDPSVPSPAASRFSLLVVAPAVLILGLVGGVMVQRQWLRHEPAGRESHLSLVLADGTTFPARNPGLALSPDGSTVVYTTAPSDAAEGTTRLFLKRLDAAAARPLRDTAGARDPFFSPDGESLGFLAGRTLKKVSLADGIVQTIVEVAEIGLQDPQWGSDGTILFGGGAVNGTDGIRRISADGGTISVLTHLQGGEVSHTAPRRVPGTGAFIFTSWISGPGGGVPRVMVQPPDGVPARVLVDRATRAQFLADGRLIYQAGDTLTVTRFDRNTLALAGPRTPVLQGVHERDGGPAWAVSGDVLAYRPLVVPARRLTWVTREGGRQPLNAPPGAYQNPSLSPSGDRVAMTVDVESGVDTWIYDLTRDVLAPFTSDHVSQFPVWSSDGNWMTFSRSGGSTRGMYRQPADGSGEPQLLFANGRVLYAADWTPDGRTLIYMQQDPVTKRDVWAIDVAGDRTPRALLRTPAMEYGARVSPNGRWMTYFSDVTGQNELYVTGLSGGPQWKISSKGAREAVWSADGRELFFRNGEQMLSVSLRPGKDFDWDPPRVLFDGRYFEFGGPANTQYDVARDGRFLMLESVAATPPHLNVIQRFAPGK